MNNTTPAQAEPRCGEPVPVERWPWSEKVGPWTDVLPCHHTKPCPFHAADEPTPAKKDEQEGS